MREQNFIPIIRTEVVTYRLKGSTVTLLEQKPAHHFAMRDRQSNFGFVGQLTDHPWPRPPQVLENVRPA